MATKKKVDWEAVEKDYRTDQLSLRALADKHKTSESTIRSRAKADGWLKDLSGAVRSATREKISRSVSRTDSGLREDAQIVDEASSEAAALILSHRAKLAEWAELADKLADSLKDAEVTPDNQLDFARALNTGVDAQTKLIKGQRQAFNIDDNPQDDDKVPSGLGHFYASTSEGDT